MIEQRLGDAGADAVVPPSFQDDDVLQVEIDAAVTDDAAHPDQRAVDVASQHGRERCAEPLAPCAGSTAGHRTCARNAAYSSAVGVPSAVSTMSVMSVTDP